MLEIYTIYGGGMWKSALDAVVGIMGNSTWLTLMRIAGTFAVGGVLIMFIKTRNPMEFVKWLAVFMLITTVLVVPKRSVQIIDITDPAAVWKTDNVPVGLAAIASLTTSIGYRIASLYDMMMSRPDSVTYTKTGMLFGSQIVAETRDFRTQNPELAQMLPDYVENCVIGDILLNHKYTVNQLLNSTDPLTLITSQPSPLRGIYKTTAYTREFLTCVQAATEIKTLANIDAQPGSASFAWLTQKVFGNKVGGATLLANAMGESYGFFYTGGLTAAQIMKNNITNGAIRQGVKGFAARSSDTANLLNLATESAATKQRLSWAAGSELATRTLPFAQSLLMLILVCLFPLVIALAAANHTLFGLNTLKIYVCGFLYFQMWPVMFAILNYAATFWLQTKTGGTPLVLANSDVVALQHSDVANLAGYLSLSIPLLAFYLTRGAASIGSQVAGSVLSSGAFGSAGVAASTADGNWSFNNMSMDNVSQNKLDTNLSQRMGQQTWQADNGSTRTMTASGMNVIDGSGAMSNLPVNMRLSQLASSGFQEQARLSQAQAQTSLDGYNHSVTSGWSQLSQLSHQKGSSETLTQGAENSQAMNASRGASMMMSAAESYAKANNISTQEAYNTLMSKSNEESVNAGIGGKLDTSKSLWGKAGEMATGASVNIHGGVDYKGAMSESDGTQTTDAGGIDHRHDKNSQMVNDFRQGMDMVTSARVTDTASHAENAGTSDVQQLAATLSDAKSQYHQFTTSSTKSDEFSRMASLSQNESASLDANYTQEFVNWSASKYGDKAQAMLTSAPQAREAAMEFVNERLKPEIMGDYQQGRSDLRSGDNHEAFTSHSSAPSAAGDAPVLQNANGGGSPVSGSAAPTISQGNNFAGGNQYSGEAQSGITRTAQPQSRYQNSSESGGYSHSGVSQSGGVYSNQTQYEAQSHSEPATLQGSVNAHGSGSGSSSGQQYDPYPAQRHVSSGHVAMTGQAKNGDVQGQTHNVTGTDNLQGNKLRDEFKQNQDALKAQSETGFNAQQEMAGRVAARKNWNEEEINNTSDNIGKNRSTVEASSGILKEEHAGAQSRFVKGNEEAKGNQHLITQKPGEQDFQSKLDELRKKAG